SDPEAREALIGLIAVIDDTIQITDKRLVRYTLEEMTIGTLLIQAYKSGRLRFVSEFEQRSGVGYIESSGKDAEKSYKGFRELIEQLISDANKRNVHADALF